MFMIKFQVRKTGISDVLKRNKTTLTFPRNCDVIDNKEFDSLVSMTQF